MSPTPEEPISVLLSDVTRLFWRRLEAALKGAGLDFTAGEARTLVNAARSPGLRQAALAERMRIEPMTLVGFLDRLEARGLVERSADPADRRAKLVRTTAAAAEMVERVLSVSAIVKAEVSAGLTPAEIEVLRDLLQRIRANLDILQDGPGACAA
ncbi:MarR family winged helix-turn-helix transcriptional regulator [Prosthecomicrobium sp. N25]|uniref:MarR family winged helix-turn-helix transcriptional regulator n=1 Tax=Prosthecomicrobium sp. N25 TaxID=3129254 RepID=UPI003077AD27